MATVPESYSRAVLQSGGGGVIVPWYPTATIDTLGVVKVDGKTIFVDEDGFLTTENPDNVDRTVIYEFYIKKNETDPSLIIEYTGVNADFTPAHMNFETGRFETGSWKKTWLTKMCRPCMMKVTGVDYYLDPNDMSKKLDGSDSDYNNPEYDGPGVFIEIDQVWIKEEEEEDRIHVYLSPVEQEGFDCYSHTDSDGNICKHIYRGKYLGYNATHESNLAQSFSGQSPIRRVADGDTGIKGDEQLAFCTNLGKGWQCEDRSFVRLMQYLHLLLGKSTDTQAVFGTGFCDGVSDNSYLTYLNGANDKRGQFYGTNDGKCSVTTFYMDDMWARQSRLILGAYCPQGSSFTINDYSFATKMTPPYISSSNPSPTDLESAGYNIVNLTGFTAENQDSYGHVYGIISGFKFDKSAGLVVDKLTPYSVEPDANKIGLCDYGSFFFGAVARWGGESGMKDKCGIFCLDCEHYIRDAYAFYGYVPMLKLSTATTPAE